MSRREMNGQPRFLDAVLRIFFALLYHQLAWSYDFVAALVSVGRWRDWVETALPYLEGPYILEIGHGPGHLQAAAVEKGLIPFGLDESYWMNRLAFRKLKNTTPPPRIVNGYAQSLPFSAACFNQVVATFPAEFVVEPSTLHEVKRTLLPGGCFIVIPFAWITGWRFSDRLARGLFHLTHQAPSWDERFLDAFHKAGFETRIEFQEVRQSKVVIIRAFKPG